MRQWLWAAVVVHNGKGWAGHRVGAAKALGKALGKGGLARAQPAGERNQRTRCQHCGHTGTQRHRLGAGMGDIF